jgi:hypothetical protein
MNQFNKENTILIYSKNELLIEQLKTIKSERDIEYYEVTKIEDFIAVHSFLIIVDSNLLNEKIFEIFNQILPFEQINELSIVLIGAPHLKLDSSIKKYTIIINEKLEGLDKIIMNKKDFMRQQSNRQSLMLQKYRRIINLYVSTLKNRQLDIDKYCEENQVTERTLRRDIKLLKDIYTDFHIYLNRSWTK